MAFKGRIKSDIDYSALQSNLLSSKAKNEDNNLFEVIRSLISGAQGFKNSIAEKLGKSDTFPANQLIGVVPTANGGTYGTLYEPSLFLIANLSGAGLDYFYYSQAGMHVHVFGKIQVTPTAIGVDTRLGIELPILSYFKFDYECCGVAYSPTVNQGASILADVANQRALLRFKSVDNVTFDMTLQLDYKIIAKS